MTGSLQTKNEKFYIVLNDMVNGKRKQRWIATGPTVKGNKRKAEQLLREKLAEEMQKAPLPVSDMRLSDCIRHWLTCVQRRVDEVTYLGYLHTAEKHILPYFDTSGLTLRDYTVKALQVYFDEKASGGRLDGKGGLSAKTLRHHRNIIRQSLSEAVKDGLIVNNPCDYVALPRHDRYEAAFYSAEQLQKLFDVMKDDPLLPLVKITALYGLRRSEVLGLKWDSTPYDITTSRLDFSVRKRMKSLAR